MSTVSIRPYTHADTNELIRLFHDAVHAINKQHYSSEQLTAWAPEDVDIQKWQQRLSQAITLVAYIGATIVGFITMTKTGYLDFLFIHKDYQGRLIALHLLRAIEREARQQGLLKIITHCSITAKLPAQFMGFKVIKEQTVQIRGSELINYVMEKQLPEVDYVPNEKKDK